MIELYHMRLVRYILLVTFLATVPVSSYAFSLSFTTPEQAIGAGVISEAFTVSTGEAVGVTSDLYITSSSPTGDFSSSETNWQSAGKLTWNSNWSNRTFYYSDTKAGTFTITAKLDIGRPPSASYVATQKVVVGGGGEVQGTSTASTLPTVPTVTLNEATFVSSGMEEVSSTFSVQIGKNRTVPVGVPIYLTASISPKSKENSGSLSWSFGDGTSALGPAVHHIYTFSGTYAVVARATIGSEFATAKILVNVLPFAVEINEIVPGYDGYISLTNYSSQETILADFSINKGAQIFKFPTDFSILANNEIRLSARVSGIQPVAPDILELRDPSGKIMTTYSLMPESLPEVIEPEKLENAENENVDGQKILELKEIQASLSALEFTALKLKALSTEASPVPPAPAPTPNMNPTPPAIGGSRNVALASADSPPPILVIERKSNMFQKILGMPRLLIGSIMGAFR